MSEALCALNSSVFVKIANLIRDIHENQYFWQDSVALPDSDDLRALVEGAFWAGLRREEGRELGFGLVFASPDECSSALVFEKARPFTPEIMFRLAPALAADNSRLGVCKVSGGTLQIWGIVQEAPKAVEVRCVRAGRVIVRYDYFRVAVIQGNNVHIVGGGEPQSVSMVAKSLPGTDAAGTRLVRASLLLQLGAVVRALNHGGTLLAVPEDNEALKLEHWQNLSISSMPNQLNPRYAGLKVEYDRLLAELSTASSRTKDLVEAKRKSGVPIAGHRYGFSDEEIFWHALPSVNDLHAFLVGELVSPSRSLASALKTVGYLTAVDGAVLLTDSLCVVGFGAKVSTSGAGIELVEWTPEDQGVQEPHQVGLTTLQGMRHQSAAHFVNQNHDAVAVVASQDGPLTVMTWEDRKGKVRMLRHMELLLD